MAPIAVIIHKQSKDDKLGVGLKGSPIHISNIVDGSLFAKSGLLTVGMQLLSINNIPLDGMTSSYAMQLLKDAEGQVVVVADNPVAVAQASSVGVVVNSSSGGKFGYIILKKLSRSSRAGFQWPLRSHTRSMDR
jgi:C-terminal processing protease CtpA/Prc